jgi:hypothetical protein
VGREDDDGFRFHFVRDFVANGLEFGVGWVGIVFEEIGTSCGGVSDTPFRKRHVMSLGESDVP